MAVLVQQAAETDDSFVLHPTHPCGRRSFPVGQARPRVGLHP
jgi:hypothetical protein